MTTSRSLSSPLPIPFRRLAIAVLALLAVAGAQVASAVTHSVDFGAGCVPAGPDCSIDPCTTIEATVGAMVNDTIEGANTGGVTPSWLFDVEPIGCTGSAPIFTCNGVIIDASSDPVTVSGIPTAGGSFSFALEGDSAEGNPCPPAMGDVAGLAYGGFILNIRDPYDIVLVLDRSGSMTSTSFISPPASDRWNALRRAVNNFTPIVASSTCAADSNIGLTFFSTGVLANNIFPNTLTAIDPATLATAVDNEMASQEPPGGSTALGSGLQNGTGKLSAPDRKRVVMVFSDGEQNQDPEVDHLTGTDYVNPAGPIHPGGAGAFKIVTVGIGTPLGVYPDAMDRLGDNNGGTYLVTATGNITDAVDAATEDLLDGCSPQMVATYSGQLQGSVSLAPFAVNRKVSQLLIRISYSRDFEVPNLIELMSDIRIEQDGTDITGLFRPIIVGNFTNAITLRTDFSDPATGVSVPPEGSYTVRMNEPANISPPLDYRAVVFADDSHLDMRLEVTPDAPRAGGAFEPSIELSYFSAPLTGATVEALVFLPGEDIGNALANNPLVVDPTEDDDQTSPGEQKFLALLEDAQFLSQILPQEQQLTLVDQGDGSYRASFNTGNVAGPYNIVYRVSVDRPAGFGTVQRLGMQSVYVRPSALDRGASAMSASVKGNTIVWAFRPVRVDGMLWGPGQAGALAVSGAGVTVTHIADDQLGGYTITLTGNPNSEVKVTLLGEEIYSGSAGGFGSEKDNSRGSQPHWLLWLLALIILLVLIWVIKKVVS